MSIAGFGSRALYVKLDAAVGFGTDLIELDPIETSVGNGGLTALVTTPDGARTKYWVPLDKVLRLQQAQGDVQPEPEQPQQPEPEEPDEPQAPPVG
jgi:hypothetical protein